MAGRDARRRRPCPPPGAQPVAHPAMAAVPLVAPMVAPWWRPIRARAGSSPRAPCPGAAGVGGRRHDFRSSGPGDQRCRCATTVFHRQTPCGACRFALQPPHHSAPRRPFAARPIPIAHTSTCTSSCTCIHRPGRSADAYASLRFPSLHSCCFCLLLLLLSRSTRSSRSTRCLDPPAGWPHFTAQRRRQSRWAGLARAVTCVVGEEPRGLPGHFAPGPGDDADDGLRSAGRRPVRWSARAPATAAAKPSRAGGPGGRASVSARARSASLEDDGRPAGVSYGVQGVQPATALDDGDGRRFALGTRGCRARRQGRDQLRPRWTRGPRRVRLAADHARHRRRAGRRRRSVGEPRQTPNRQSPPPTGTRTLSGAASRAVRGELVGDRPVADHAEGFPSGSGSAGQDGDQPHSSTHRRHQLRPALFGEGDDLPAPCRRITRRVGAKAAARRGPGSASRHARGVGGNGLAEVPGRGAETLRLAQVAARR